MLTKLVKMLIIIAIAAYAFVLAVFWFAQSAMIYPNQGTHLSQCDLPKGTEIFNEHIDGFELNGIFTKTDNHKILIFFHGNNESACSWRFAGINHIAAHGYDTLIMEYPGYAGLDGKPSIERNKMMTDALAKWLEQNDYDKTVVLGYSLGSGIASMLTKEIDPDALLLFAPYDRMANVVRDIAPFIPSFIVQENYKNDKELSNHKGPITIVHGSNDNVISPARSESLAKSLIDVDSITLADRGHHGLFETKFFDELLRQKLP